MELLRHSIQSDGYTQPIVAMKQPDGYEVVDGFHRHRVGKECAVGVTVKADADVTGFAVLAFMPSFIVAAMLSGESVTVPPAIRAQHPCCSSVAVAHAVAGTRAKRLAGGSHESDLPRRTASAIG